MMKLGKILVVSMIILLALAAIAGCGSSNIVHPSTTVSASATNPAPASSPAATATAANAVIMSGYAFTPAEITINKGETVTWTNQDSAKHDVIGSNFKSDLFGKGETFSQTFNESGTFEYKCSVHPGMVGKVIVK